MFVLEDFQNVSARVNGTLYAWVTYGTGYDDQQTSLVHLRRNVICDVPRNATTILITIIQRPKSKSSFTVLGNARFMGDTFTDTTNTSTIKLRRLMKNSMTIEDVGIKIKAPLGWNGVVVTKKQQRQDKEGLYQTVAACADGIENVTLSYGHPYLKCGPWFAGKIPVRSGLWDRYVARAIILSGFTGTMEDIQCCELDLLLAVAVQGCTGVYEQEREDDRSIEELTFGTNADCDDQAATCASLVEALLHENVREEPQTLGDLIHMHLRHHYEEAAIIVGNARSPTNPPNSKPFGHAWAAILRKKGTFAGALHIEPTAPMSTLTADGFDKRIYNQSRWARLFDSNTYNVHSKRCADLMVKKKISGNRIVGVRVAERHFYGHPCMAMTKSHLYEWPKTVRTPWLDMIMPGVHLTSPFAVRQTGANPKELHHLPDRLNPNHLPVGYHQFNPGSPITAPTHWLGVVSSTVMLNNGKVTPHTVVIDPFQIMHYITEE